MTLKNTLIDYQKKGMYPFHMPGHKRNMADVSDCYQIDMTEVDGVDDLHDPDGPILEEQKKIAELYGADESYILVGGSTVGNLSAIYATACEGDKVLIPRNSHKSVYNALTLRHCNVSYIDAEINDDGIYEPVKVSDIREAVEKEPDIKVVMITSPTYEGYHSDIKAISDLCHEKNLILIVDQAHGAHLGMHEEFKNSSAKYADITIMSLHKTLPALTQTAVLNIKGERVDSRKVREALDIFETSSPSYVLMNSVSECIDILESKRELFQQYVDNLNAFYHECEHLKHLALVTDESEKKDPGKIIISTKKTNISGVTLARMLREQYLIETELSSFTYVIAMTSIMDTRDGFERLAKALKEIDERLVDDVQKVPRTGIRPQKAMELYQAKSGRESLVKLTEAKSLVSSGMICIYPPGAPIVVPGEIITEEAIGLIETAQAEGLHITGVREGLVSVVN